MLGRAAVSCCGSSQGLRCLDRLADVVELAGGDEDALAKSAAIADLSGRDETSNSSG